MFEKLFEDGQELTFKSVAIVFIVSLFCGILISLIHVFTHKNKKENSIAFTLLILPVIVAFIINLVASNIAMAFSLAGIFTLIRFRSEPAESKDVTYVLIAAGIGLSCGLGYVTLAIVLTILLGLLLVVLHFINFAKPTNLDKTLKVICTEEVDFENQLPEVLNKHCTYFQLQKVKSCDFGSLFEIVYYIRLKNQNSIKALLDEVRIINSNLDVSINYHCQ